MADNVGDLNLLISGDLSPLEQAFADIPAVAQTAAANIDAALASIGEEGTGATAGIQSLSDALQGLWAGDNVSGAEQLDSAIQGVGQAAAVAGPDMDSLVRSMNGTNEAAHSSAEAVHESESAFTEWKESAVETLEKLGLMIGAFEALKESIEAFATEQAFVVSMTALTGSAETAVTTLEELKATALELPVALDSLLSAAQKMTALGVSLEAIPDLLRASADAAAATGNAFDAVASGLERVMVTGQVMARSLVQMGLTWQQVAEDMGVSVEQAQAAFKKGAQSAEEDVRILVDTIEQQYGGMSAKLADTIGGSFTILKNQLGEFAAQAGELLAPLVMGLMQIVSGIVSVLSDAFKGLSDVFGPIIQAFTSLGPIAAQLADVLGALTIVVGGLMIAFDISGWGLIVAAVGALAEILGSLSDHEQSAADKAKQLADYQQILKDDTNAEEVAATNLSNTLARQGIIIDQAGLSADAWGKKLQQVYDTLENGNKVLANAAAIYEAFSGILKGAMPSFDAFKKAIEDNIASLKTAADQSIYDAIKAGHQKLQQAANSSAEALKIATDMLHSGTIGLNEYNTYVDANRKAQQALGDTIAGTTKATAAQTEAVKEAEQQTKAWNTALDKVAALMPSIDSSIQLLDAGLGNFGQQATLGDRAVADMEKTFQSMQATIDGFMKVLYASTQAQRDQVAALDLTMQSLRDFEPMVKLAGDSLATAGQAMKDAAASGTEFGDVMTALTGAIREPIAAMQAHDEAVKALSTEWQTLGLTVKKAATDIPSLIDGMNQAFGSGLFSVEKMNDAMAKLSTSMVTTVDSARKVYDALVSWNAPQQIVLAAQLRMIDLQLQQAQYTDMTGQSELRLAQAVTQVQLQQFALHQQTMGMADEWKKITTDLATAWQGVGNSIATALISGQNFGQAMLQMVEQVAEKIIGTLIQGALNDLAASLIKNSGLLQSFSTTATQTMGDVGTAMGNAAKSMENFGTTTTTTMTQTATSVANSASQMISTFSLIATAIGAIASIFSAIELMHTNTLLGRIEESTRRTDITVEGAVVTSLAFLDNYLPIISTNLWTIMANTANALNDLGYIAADIHGMAAAIAAGGFGGGGGTGGMTAQIADALAHQAALIDILTNQLNSIQTQVGGGGPQPSYVILGGGGGTASYSTPSISTSLPTGSTGVFTNPSVTSSIAPSGGVQVNVSVSAGVVAGAGGMQQLANMVGQQVVQTFRGAAGLKN